MYGMFDLARDTSVSVLPVYAVSEDPAATILDVAATLGVGEGTVKRYLSEAMTRLAARLSPAGSG